MADLDRFRRRRPLRRGAGAGAGSRAGARADRRADRSADRSADPGRGEGGYLLVYVLAVIGLTSVVVIALLGLTLTSARVAAMEARLAKEQRAADGALEAQLSRIAASTGDACDSLNSRTVTGSTVSPDVDVECTWAGVSNNIDDPLFGPDVEVFGSADYRNPDTSTGKNLVVRGTSQPARFDSDVYVKGGGDITRTTGTPAVAIAGQYQQGAAAGGGGCGNLATVGPNQIVDAGGLGAPSCGTAPSISPAMPPDVSSIPALLGNRNLSCASGTVNLAPGKYTATDIEGLNDLFGGTAACTVVFQPGDHFLDVFDARKSGELRFVLAISNPNVKIIGGQPSGQAFPRACRTGTGADGVQMILSPRSAIRQTAGQVALCPKPAAGGGWLPVIRQSANVTSQPMLQSASTDFLPSANLAFGSTMMARARLCGWSGFTPYCNAKSFTSTVSNAGTGPLDSAWMLLDMQTVPTRWDVFGNVVGTDRPASYHRFDVRVRFQVSKGGSQICTTDTVAAGRTESGTMAFNLRGLGGTCQTALTNLGQLDGATITSTVSTASAEPAQAVPFVMQGLNVDIRNVRMQTNTVQLNGSSIGTSDPRWTNSAAVLAPGGTPAELDQGGRSSNDPNNPLYPLVMEQIAGSQPKLTIGGFKLAGSGLSPNDAVSRLGVLIKGPSDQISFRSDAASRASGGDGGATSIKLTLSSGASCSTTNPGYGQSNAYERIDLKSGGCASTVTKMSDLEGATLEVSYLSGCAVPLTTNGTKCASIAIPRLDHVALDVGSDTYGGTSPYWSVSVDTANKTSFDAFGAVEIPTSDLEVRWVGTTYPRPLFAGRLQVNGLGIEQVGPNQGVVCCVVNEQGAVLVARVGGQVRAQAAVIVDPTKLGTATTRRNVDIVSWRLCGRAGC